MAEWRKVRIAPEEPDDGVSVLAWIPAWDTVEVAFRIDGRWWMPVQADGCMTIPCPSDWMPVPERPSPKRTDGDGE